MLYPICFFPELYNGGNNDGDPPLSIPNREVKPISADGTATIPSGRVGSRQFVKSVVERVLSTALFCFMFYQAAASEPEQKLQRLSQLTE